MPDAPAPPTSEEVQRIAVHHRLDRYGWCDACAEAWPCPTRRLADTYMVVVGQLEGMEAVVNRLGAGWEPSVTSGLWWRFAADESSGEREPMTPAEAAALRERGWTRAEVWTGQGDQCNEADDAGSRCDLLLHHDGPHFYVLDHDDDGDPRLIATWPVGEAGALREALDKIVALSPTEGGLIPDSALLATAVRIARAALGASEAEGPTDGG